LQTADGQTFIYQPMGVDGSGNSQSGQNTVLGINGSLIPLTSNSAGTVNATAGGGTITIPQNLGLTGTNIVSAIAMTYDN
jgi:hypothetical protein